MSLQAFRSDVDGATGAVTAWRSALWLVELLALALAGVAVAFGWPRGLVLALLGIPLGVHLYMDAALVKMRCHLAHSARTARAELRAMYGDRLCELSTMQSALAHELKNPLASIKGLAGLMALGPDRAAERLALLQKEVGRMQELVESMLSFSRPLTPLAPETTDVQAVMHSAAELHEEPAGTKRLRLDASRVQPLKLVGDPRKIKQMVLNLLCNAIEFSAAGSTIELFAERDGDSVLFGVRDRGPGVPTALLPRIDQAGVSTKPDGPGLGLTIVRALATQHGGSLRLTNREGGGLSAAVALPLRCPKAAAALA
jgi:two-component system, NtrC family, sensor histidine kinase HydH